MRKLAIFISLILAISLTGCGEPKLDYTEFAKCITQKGVVFYGSSTCSHCAKQKKELGDAMQYIKYVECNPNTDFDGAKKCLEEKIEGYPTWKLSDGTALVGEQNFEQLGLRIGCEAPKLPAE